MANQPDELAILRSQLGALTARIYRLEQKMGLDAAPLPGPASAASPVPPPPPFAATAAQTAPPGPASVPAQPPLTTASGMPAQVSRTDSSDLEGKIGKLWFSWIGIFAILAGVAYFLKYAFESGLIGERGRVA